MKRQTKSRLAGVLGSLFAITTWAVEVTHQPDSGVLPAGLPFSESVRVGDMLYLSGQVGVKPGELTLVAGGIEAEARQTMKNIEAVLTTAGLELDHVVKCTVMLDDMLEWPVFNRVYAEFFEPPYPARSAFGADGLALGARVEVECLAAFPDE